MTGFPDTRTSIIEALADDDPDRRRRAADLLIRAYRAPVLDHIRWRWHLDDADAEDVTQEFFSEALAHDWLARFDPARARFRTFLRVCAQRFVAKHQAAEITARRGGGAAHIPLDDVSEILPDEEADRRFRAEWIRSVFGLALAALRDEALPDRTLHLILFEAYDLAEDGSNGRPTYAALGRGYDLTETQVLNHLAWARRRFRVHVLDVLRTLAGSDGEYRDDVRDLLGIEA